MGRGVAIGSRHCVRLVLKHADMRAAHETDGARLYPLEMPNLANYLLALPEPLETERDTTPLRGMDFV